MFYSCAANTLSKYIPRWLLGHNRLVLRDLTIPNDIDDISKQAKCHSRKSGNPPAWRGRLYKHDGDCQAKGLNGIKTA